MLLKVETRQYEHVFRLACACMLSVCCSILLQHVFFTSCEAACGFPHVIQLLLS
ncbi:hypothetical protein LDENG_00265470 [Lucifuga dentata]|nr:hypothetical protein LDENG_00265470 [Lucifuga dentata]